MDLSLFILLATLPVLIIAWVVMRAMVRRRQIREIARFHESPRVSDADFLEVLGIDGDADDAGVALWLRDAVAALGSVPGDSLHPSQQFYPDLEQLPFYDSPDFLELIVLIEDGLNVQVPEEDEQELLHAAQKGSVGEFIGAVLEWRRRQTQPALQD